MSNQQPPERQSFARRALTPSEQDQQEIRDWINASGGMVLGAIAVIIVAFFLATVIFK